MNEVTRSSRISTALQVIQRMNEGLCVSSACKEVGMPRSSFYAIITREREAVAEFQDIVAANNQSNLLILLANKTAMLQKLVREALTDTTSPRERLAIYKALTELQDKLIDDLRLHSRGAAVSTDMFTGPILQLAKSRFTSGYVEDYADTHPNTD